MKNLNALQKTYLIIIFMILYVPILVLGVYSFNASNSTSVLTGFSIKWYGELLRDAETIAALKNTVVLAVISSVVSTVLGTVAAVGINYSRSKYYKKALMTTTNIPMMNPDIVTGISMMLLFVFVGSALGISGILGFSTLLIAHITFQLPYVVLNILPRLKSMDKYLTEAAMDLGCTPVQAFFKVTLPYISTSIFSGFIMAFTLSLDDFVISYFVSGPEFQTLPIRIYSMTKKRVTPDMYALSTIIFVVILALLLLSNYFGEEENRKKIKRRTLKNSEGRASVKAVLTVVAVLVIAFSTQITSHAIDAVDEEYYKSFSKANGLGGTTLNVYNWGEYISDGAEGSMNINAYFEELTGIDVNYTNFASNEDMYAKLKSGGAAYDVIIPSDYMIDRLRNEDMLLKLNYGNIPNYKYIDDDYKDLYFDPKNEYTVPYTYGFVALIYNEKLVDEKPDSWKILWDEKYAGQILMFNNPRDAFAIAQSLNGVNLNTTDADEWALAYDTLLMQKPVVRAYVMDEIFNIMESGAAALAPYYAGDFLTMADNNPDLKIAFPKEGANIFVDSICIPSTCQNKTAAELYINFLNEPEVALENAEWICYATPHTAVTQSEDYSLRDSEVLYPDEALLEKYEYFHNLPSETQALMSNYWSDLKIEGDRNISVYVGLISFAVLVTAYGVYAYAKKKHREKYYD